MTPNKNEKETAGGSVVSLSRKAPFFYPEQIKTPAVNKTGAKTTIIFVPANKDTRTDAIFQPISRKFISILSGILCQQNKGITRRGIFGLNNLSN